MNSIIVPAHRRLSVPPQALIHSNSAIGIGGEYRLQVRRPDGRVRIDTGFFSNLITNYGLNRIGTDGDQFVRVCVGSGSTAPANSDTQLASFVASTVNFTGQAFESNTSISPYYGGVSLTYRFLAGEATGNLTEIGIGKNSGSFELFSRALIVDGSNNPTTITVLPDEVLDVTYRCRVYVPTADTAGSITITGLGSRNYTRRAAQAGNWGVSAVSPVGGIGLNSPAFFTGSLGAVTGEPSGTSGGGSPTGSESDAYSNNSLVRTFNYTWALESGVIGGSGIKSVLYQCGIGYFQTEFNTAINKTVADVLKLNFTQSWARFTPP